MNIKAGDLIRYNGKIVEVWGVHPDEGVQIGPYEFIVPDLAEKVEATKMVSTITPGPWRWEFIGNAGNYFLVGNDGRGPIVHGGPHSADGELMRSAWEVQSEVARLQAQVEAMRQLLAGIITKVDDHPYPNVGTVYVGLSQAEIERLRAALGGE